MYLNAAVTTQSIAEKKLAELSRIAADLNYRPGAPGAKEAAKNFQRLASEGGIDGTTDVATNTTTKDLTPEEQLAVQAIAEAEEAKSRCQKVVQLLVAHQEAWGPLLTQMGHHLDRMQEESWGSSPCYTCQGSKVAEMMQKVYSSTHKKARRVKGGGLLQRAQACIDACIIEGDSDHDASDDSEGEDIKRPAKKARAAAKVEYELENDGASAGDAGGTMHGARRIPARFTHDPNVGGARQRQEDYTIC